MCAPTDLQALADRDVAVGAPEATERRVVASSEVARVDEDGAHWVHVFAGSQCVVSAVCTSTEQWSQKAPEQGQSRVYGMEAPPHDEPPPSPCLMQ